MYAHSEILVRSWFKISADLLGSLTAWNIDASSLKIKSTAASLKDLDTNFGAVNYSTDICIIGIAQNALYSMTVSVVEIYIQENQQQENLHLVAAPQIWSGKRYSQNLGKIHGKCLQRSPLFCKAAG